MENRRKTALFFIISCKYGQMGYAKSAFAFA